jgi:hypothetical protein
VHGLVHNGVGGKSLAPGVIRDVDFHNAHSDLPSGSFGLRLQPVDATHSAKRSAGVLNCNVSLGRPFSRFATAFNLF